MTGDPDPYVAYLSASPARVDVLGRLVDRPARPAELVEHADVSRTTVHRTLGELIDRSWVRRDDGSYVATGAGELALETYRETRTAFRLLDRFAPVLARVETFEREFEPRWLEGAALETATEESPQRPLEWYADRLEAADGDWLRGTSPVVNRQSMTVHAPVVRDGVRTELVVGERTLRAVADGYPERLRESIALEGYDLYVASERPELGITIYGETVFLGAYDDERRLRAIAKGTGERLQEWAEHRYRRHRDGERRVTPDVIDEID